MDFDRFDHLVLTLTHASTRRSVLGLLGALGLVGLMAQDVAAVCRANRQRCTTGAECCSGRCVRKRGTNKRLCRQAPGQGVCTIASDMCAGTGAPCADGGSNSCVCSVTTRGYSFCGENNASCGTCNTDADCEQRPTGQVGDRCVPCALCGAPPNDRACLHECPTPATA